ncbi:MAG: extracellular solute-binding protein [Erysipelotrichaceae bacterium]|nr:extracellular solute-binding protein [Erysipelotrichaceae bacterium]
MKKLLTLLLAAALLLAMAGCGSKQTPSDQPAGEETAELSGKLVLYSPANEEEYNMVVDAFKAKYPNVEIETVQGGSGELKTRLEGEQENPQADVMFGGLTQADAYAYKDLWADYVSPNDAGLAEAYRNDTGKVTMKSINIQVLFYNNELAEQAGVEITGLQDLLNPALKGKIVMADPSASATAYRWLTCILYVMGNGDPESEEAWNYLEALIQNLDGKLASSMSNTHKGVYEGEYVVGLTSESNGVSYLEDGFGDKVTVVYPAEGTTAASYGVALINKCPNEETGKAFIDFIISDEGQQIYAESSLRPANFNFKNTSEFLPDVTTIKLVTEDYQYIAEHRQEILDRFNNLWAKYN